MGVVANLSLRLSLPDPWGRRMGVVAIPALRLSSPPSPPHSVSCGCAVSLSEDSDRMRGLSSHLCLHQIEGNSFDERAVLLTSMASLVEVRGLVLPSGKRQRLTQGSTFIFLLLILILFSISFYPVALYI